MLASKLFNARTWVPKRDDAGVVHHVSQLTKKEVEYVFRLADAVRAAATCSDCGAKEGESCVRKKDGRPRSNHSARVRYAAFLFHEHVLPKRDRFYQTLCSVEGGPGHVLFGLPEHHTVAVDCMTCLVIAARQGARPLKLP